VARKKKHEEHVNHERWLVSYADFITLLFAFFTTLYAISTVDAKKAGKLVFAMRQAFNLDFFVTDKPVLGLVPPDRPVSDVENLAPKPDAVDEEIPRRRRRVPKGDGKASPEEREIKNVALLLRRVLAAIDLGRHVKMRFDPRGLVLSLEEVGFFRSGSSRLRPAGLALLRRVGTLLRDLGHSIRVEGHADDRGSELANWELSVSRAVAVVRDWVANVSFPPGRLVAAGYGSHRPVARNLTPDERARNRRVDVVILSPEAARDDPP
jgi:chemotaxis protein MotB